MQASSCGAVAAALLAAAGCGPRAGRSPDVGAAPFAGRQSFDVVATLDLGGVMLPNDLPPTLPFTLVLDADAGQAIVGGRGTATTARLTRDGEKLVVPSFSVDLASAACSGASSVEFTSMVVAANGTTLSGSGSGDALVSCGDCQFDVPFNAALAGAPDVTPPLLFPTALPASPFAAFSLAASEPLTATSTARLVAEDGTTVNLVPKVVAGDVSLVSGFDKPNVVLPTGVGLSIAVDGLVDLAGLQGAADTPLRFVVFPTPPLVADAGFEDATGPTFGGATVISGGPLPPISGTRSVYLGGAGTPAPDGAKVGTALRVRLAVPAGATTLAFTYRLVGAFMGGGFTGTIGVGTVGKTPASYPFMMELDGTATTWPDGQTVFVTDAATQELALPADVGSEVLVDIESFDDGCGRPMPPLGGILLDDLRVE